MKTTSSKWLDGENTEQHNWVVNQLQKKGSKIAFNYDPSISMIDNIDRVIKECRKTAEGREAINSISANWYAKSARAKKKADKKTATNYYLEPTTIEILKEYKKDYKLPSIEQAIDHLVEAKNEDRLSVNKVSKKSHDAKQNQLQLQIEKLEKKLSSVLKHQEILKDKLKLRELTIIQYLVKLQDADLLAAPLSIEQQKRVDQYIRYSATVLGINHTIFKNKYFDIQAPCNP